MIVRELFTRLGFKVDQSGAQQYDAALSRMQSRAQAVSTAVGTTLGVLAANAITAIASAVAGAAANLGGNIVRAGDQQTATMNRLNAALEGTGENADEVLRLIREGALQTGTAIDETAGAFMRFAPAMRDAGRSAADTVAVLTNLQKSFLAAGATTAESTAVMRQLGQAMNSSKLGGEELNSFLEQAGPTLTRSFAEAMGTTVDNLKKMAEQGAISGERLVNALTIAARRGAGQFDNMTVPLELAMARLRVATTWFWAELDQTLGITRALTRAAERMQKAFEWMAGKGGEVRALIRDMGGLREAIIRVATALAALALAWLAVNFATAIGVVMGLTRAMWGLAAAINASAMKFFLIATAIYGVFLVLDDLMSWIRSDGRRNWFGDQLGPISELGDRIREAFIGIGRAFAGDAGARAFKGILEGIIWAIDQITTLAPIMRDALIDAFSGGAARAGESLRERLLAPLRRLNFNQHGQLQFGQYTPPSPLPATAGGGPRTSVVTQNAPVNLTVNAVSNDPGGVAQAARAGVARGLSGSLEDLNRRLGSAVPRAEAAAQ